MAVEAAPPMTAPCAAACLSSPPAEEPAPFVPRALLRPRRDTGQSARPADGAAFADPDARVLRCSPRARVQPARLQSCHPRCSHAGCE
eukprot:2339376-Prymnesium_polylepis.1